MFLPAMIPFLNKSLSKTKRILKCISQLKSGASRCLQLRCLPFFLSSLFRPLHTLTEQFPQKEQKTFTVLGPHAKSVLSERSWMVWLDDYEMNLFLKAAGTVWHLGLKTFFFLALEDTLFGNIADISGGLRTEIDNDTFKGSPLLLLNRSPKDINFWRTTAVMTTHWHCQFPDRSQRQACRATAPLSAVSHRLSPVTQPPREPRQTKHPNCSRENLQRWTGVFPPFKHSLAPRNPRQTFPNTSSL